jgi:Spy/CpxP family protein refolding chaperone
MIRSAAIPIAALAFHLALPAAAQHAGPHGGAHHRHTAGPGGATAQPYAALEGRRTKALSEEDTNALLAGRGMGLALAAELNGYPGPMHVLEHADALRLTPAQRATAEALRDRIAGEARVVGARIVAAEEELDRLFATGAAEAASLAALTASIGALNGRLREVHLATHIAMREALQPDQRSAYARLRGYAGDR